MNLNFQIIGPIIFEPLWNHNYIESVNISWSEKIGVGDRGGYFNNYGIIRDVMQNHLLQILSLATMEQPVSLNAEDVRDEKVRVLRCIKPVDQDNLIIGQYKGKKIRGIQYPSYKN